MQIINEVAAYIPFLFLVVVVAVRSIASDLKKLGEPSSNISLPKVIITNGTALLFFIVSTFYIAYGTYGWTSLARQKLQGVPQWLISAFEAGVLTGGYQLITKALSKKFKKDDLFNRMIIQFLGLLGSVPIYAVTLLVLAIINSLLT